MNFWGLPKRFIFQNPQTRRTAQQTSRGDLEAEPGTPSSAPPERERTQDRQAQLEEERRGREMNVRVGSAQERSGQALEILDERTQANLIRNIDLDQSQERQVQAVTKLNWSMAYEVVPKLREAGVSEAIIHNAVSKPADFERAVRGLQNLNLDESGRAALEKFIQIVKRGQSNFSQGWLVEWPRDLTQTLTEYNAARGLRDTPPSSFGERLQGYAKTTWNYMRNNKVETALYIAGGFVAWRILRGIFGKKEEAQATSASPTQQHEEESTAWKWTKRILWGATGVGGLVILSKILPMERIKNWLSEAWENSFLARWTSSPEERAQERRERNELNEEAARQMGIDDPELLTMFGEYDYEPFMSFRGEVEGQVRGQTRRMFAESIWGTLADTEMRLLPDSLRRFFEKKKNEPEKVMRAERKLRQFLERHADTTREIYPRAKVREIIAGLSREGIFGEKFADRPMQVTEEQVPPTIQAQIQQHYPTIRERNRVTSLAVRVNDHREEQNENIFGPRGLIARLEVMAQRHPQDRSYRQKIDELRRLHRQLETRKTSFHEAVSRGTSHAELKEKVARGVEAQEGLEETYDDYLAEIQSHIGMWRALPFFAIRYGTLGKRRRASIQADVRRAVTNPAHAAREIVGVRNPVHHAQDLYESEGRHLAEYESEKRLSHAGREAALRSPTTAEQREWQERQLRVRAARDKVILEERRLEFRNLPREARESRYAELLADEHHYLEALRDRFHSSIEHAKNLLGTKTLHEREMVEYFRDIQSQGRMLRSGLSDYRSNVMREAERLGKRSREAIDLVQNFDGLSKQYRSTVRGELSFFHGLWRWVKRRGSTTTEAALRTMFKDWMREEKRSGLVRFIRAPGTLAHGAKIGVLGLLMAPGLVAHAREIRERDPEMGFLRLMAELGPSTGQLLLDVVPVGGTFSDFYTVWTGQEVISRRKVRGWDRYSRVIWGSIGALFDVALIFPVLDIAGGAGEVVTRLARLGIRGAEARKIVRLWPKIKNVAERLGGWKKFAEHLKNYRGGATRIDRLRATRGMAITAGTRLAGSVMVGEIAYNAFYSGGEDQNDTGEELDPDLINETEAEAQGNAPH